MSGIIAQNTLLSSGLVKSPAGGGAWNFISKATASSSATIDFTSGIDSTYREYIFTFNKIHPSADGASFDFQANADGESGYNETITSTQWQAYHKEDGSAAGSGYNTSNDQANGTSFQNLNGNIDNANDASGAGYLHLYNPSSTTFVTHFLAFMAEPEDGSPTPAVQLYTSGYFNTTAAIDDIQFKMSSGNIDSGDICLYGLTT